MQIYYCDAHGVGQDNCCKEAEHVGWYEERTVEDEETTK